MLPTDVLSQSRNFSQVYIQQANAVWIELQGCESVRRASESNSIVLTTPGPFFFSLMRYKLGNFLRSIDIDDAVITAETAMTLLCDIYAFHARDPACQSMADVIQFYKTFDAVLLYRASHDSLLHGRHQVARRLNYYSSCLFGVDIHPAAKIGHGLFIDHGTGVVIGETCIIGNNVSIMQGVTLGGNGKEVGNRHPIVKDGVLIGAGAKVLGRITLGESVKVGAGSVVLDDVPDGFTIVGVPGKVKNSQNRYPSLNMDHAVVARDEIYPEFVGSAR